MTFRLPVSGWVVGATCAVVLTGACTSLLGSFEEAPAVAVTSTSGTGGAASSGVGGVGGAGQGGAGGAGGAEPVTVFGCGWANPSHQPLGKPSNSTVAVESVHIVSRSSAKARVVVTEFDSVTSMRSMAIYGPGSSYFAYPKDFEGILDVGRLGPSSIGILISTKNANQVYGVAMLEVPDSPETPAAADVRMTTVVPLTGWPVDGAPGAMPGKFDGRFVVTDSQVGSWAIDYALGYRTGAGAYVATFGHTKNTAQGSQPFVITPPGYASTEQDIQLNTRLLHIPAANAPSGKSTTYVYLGNPSPNSKNAEFAADASTKGFVTPRDLGLAAVVGMMGRPDGFNVALATVGNNLGVHTYKLPFAKLGNFTLDDVPTTVTLNGFGYIPVGETAVDWFGDVFTLIGAGQFLNEGVAPLKFAFFDAAARERGHGELPFTGNLEVGTTRLSVNRVSATSSDTSGDALMREFEVAWIERQKSMMGASFDVVYYDRLKCVASEPNP